MKWWNPPKTLEGLKKRGQWYLLTINIIVATANFLLLGSTLDKPQMILYCRTVSFTDTICAEAK
jgi:hypothetical protein